jgi:hypothetical protein
MYENECKKWVGGIGRMLLAWVLLFAQGAWAGQEAKTPDKAGLVPKSAVQQTNEKQFSTVGRTKAQTEEAEGEPAGSVRQKSFLDDASHQGIKVHGHWTIEVRNPDGSLVRHQEFENALVPGAGSTLGYLLDGQILVAGLGVRLYASTGSSPCYGLIKSGSSGLPTSGPTPCNIVTTSTGLTAASNIFPNLAAAVNVSNGVTVSGTATASLTGSIDTVASDIHICTAPGPCVAGQISPDQFTSAPVSPVISVSVGQTVAVTVVISFS